MRIVLFAIVAALSLAGCSKKEEPAGAAPPSQEAKAPPAEPFTGKLTEALLTEAKTKVKPYMKWDEAEAALLPIIGKPTGVIENEHIWAFMEGEKCFSLQVENNDGEVGAVQVGNVDKMMKSMYEKCVKGAGAVPGSPDEPGEADEEPSAAGGEGADGSGLETRTAPVGSKPGRKKNMPRPSSGGVRDDVLKQAPDDEDEDPIKGKNE